MTRNCTQNDLVRLLYGDLEKDAYTCVLKEVNSDWDSQEELASLQQAKQYLPKVSFAPAPASISNILEFSRRTAITMHLN